MADRPRVFVSSTIYDFRDLRSALKFFFSELGYDAQLSEYNDFSKDLDESSFNACLTGVESADYFLLFIGSRVGGLFSEVDRLSITRQEYRRAYDSFIRSGKPRIVAFVRSDVWTVREDRRALERLLVEDDAISREISPESSDRIGFHSSRVVNDAKAIFEFIDEVRRKNEMIAAVAKGGDFPRGNWVHAFATFEDVVSVLRRDIGLGSIRKAAVSSNLRAELLSIADWLMMSETGSPAPMWKYLGELRGRLGDDFDDVVNLSRKDLGKFAGFGLLAMGREFPRTVAIEEAIRSGEYLAWNSQIHAFVPTLLHQGLVRLRDNVALLRRQGRKPPETRDEWLGGWREAPEKLRRIHARDLIPYCAVHDRHENILSLTSALLVGLSGDLGALERVRLWPDTPMGALKTQSLRTGTSRLRRLEQWLRDQASPIESPQAKQEPTEPTSLTSPPRSPPEPPNERSESPVARSEATATSPSSPTELLMGTDPSTIEGTPIHQEVAAPGRVIFPSTPPAVGTPSRQESKDVEPAAPPEPQEEPPTK